MIVDFHSHTSRSDGTLEPQALAQMMRRRGVSVFSVTDHDTLDAYAAFHGALSDAARPPRVVVGVEINTTHRGNEVHLLGYGVRLDDPRGYEEQPLGVFRCAD